MLSVASAHIALPINRLRYVTHGAGSAQGAASRHPATSRVPCLVSCPAALRLRGPTDSQTRLGRPGKASAATRQKNRRTFSMPLRRHFLRPSGKTDKQAGKSKQTFPGGGLLG